MTERGTAPTSLAGNLHSLVVSLIVAACFTWAAVFSQAGAATSAPPPGGAQEKKVAKPEEKPARAKAGDSRITGTTVRFEGPRAETREVFVKAVGKQAVNRVAQPNRAPLIQQFANQARPLLRAELIFARNVCQLNRDQFRKVNQQCQEMLDEVVGKLVDAQFQPRLGPQVKGPGANNLDPQQLLSDGVVAVMKRELTSEQWSRYDIERQKRA